MWPFFNQFFYTRTQIWKKNNTSTHYLHPGSGWRWCLAFEIVVNHHGNPPFGRFYFVIQASNKQIQATSQLLKQNSWLLFWNPPILLTGRTPWTNMGDVGSLCCKEALWNREEATKPLGYLYFFPYKVGHLHPVIIISMVKCFHL